MVRIESKATELDRPWEEMVQAVIQKYPNPHSKSARVSDIISRHVNCHGHVITERYSGNKESGVFYLPQKGHHIETWPSYRTGSISYRLFVSPISTL